MRFEAESRQEKNWLVKSSTRILGPFNLDEIAQLLLKKHISIIDEVRQPEGRWKYIRENRVFDNVVQTLRAEQESSGEMTQTQTLTATAATSVTITKTDALHIGEETPTPTPPPVPTLARSDLAFPGDGAKDVTPGGIQPILPKMPPSPSADPAMQRQIKKAQNMIRVFVALFVVAVIGAVFYMQTRKTVFRDQGYDALISEALRYRGIQLYDKALAAYKKAAVIREPDASVQNQMAIVLIVLDRQTAQGRRILERELADDKNGRSQQIDASLGIAISYILEGSLREAEEALQRVLILEPQNFNARLNLGLVALRKGDAKDALRQLNDLARRTAAHPLLLLGRSLAFMQIPERDETMARTLSSEIRSFLGRSSQFRQELLMVNAALMSPSDPELSSLIGEFLSQVTHQSSQYARDPRLDWRVADWEVLERTCRDFTSRFSGARVKAMRSICLSEAGRDTESRRFLDQAVAESPKDPLVLFTQANLLYRNGLRNEAYAVLRLPEIAALPAHQTLIGKICLDQGDMGCAENAFRAVLANGTDDVALAGLAQVMQKQERRAEVSSLVREGLDREPGYLPLIEIRESWESK